MQTGRFDVYELASNGRTDGLLAFTISEKERERDGKGGRNAAVKVLITHK